MKTKLVPSKACTESTPLRENANSDASQMNYRYEIFDHTEASKRKNRLDPARRDLNTDHTPDYDEIVMISKDTAYIDEDGRIIRETITRPLGSEFDFLNTYIVNIYPDTTVWVNDFENAYNEPYVRLYFSHAGYNDYPGRRSFVGTSECILRLAYRALERFGGT